MFSIHIFIIVTLFTCGYSQNFKTIHGNSKLIADSIYKGEHKLSPLSLYMLNPLHDKRSLNGRNNVASEVVKPVSEPDKHIGTVSDKAEPNCDVLLPEVSALEASFPKIDTVPSNRRLFRKTVRSPCSHVGSNNGGDGSSSNSNQNGSSDNENRQSDNSSNDDQNTVSSGNNESNTQSDNSETLSSNNNNGNRQSDGSSNDQNSVSSGNNEPPNSQSNNSGTSSSNNDNSNNSLNPEDSNNSESNSNVRRSRDSSSLSESSVVSTSSQNTNVIKVGMNHNSSMDTSEIVNQFQNLEITSSPKSLNYSTDLSDVPTSTNNQLDSQTVHIEIPSVALLDLPNGPIYAVPGIDTPSQPTFNSKRAVSKLRPSLKRKSLKQTSESSSHPEVSEVSSNLGPVVSPVSDLAVPQISSVGSDQLHDVNSSSSSQQFEKSLIAHSTRASKNSRRKQTLQKSLAGSNSASSSLPGDDKVNGEQSPVINSSPSLDVSNTLVSDRENNSAQVSVATSLSKDKKQMATSSSKKVTSAQEHIPCTCGVFLSGQFTKGKNAEPNGNPVVEQQLEQTFPCTAAGKNQCQNKCLDMMVKHLPNSGTIICGSIEGDIYKEKAYLWLKHCHDVWVNTNLSSGKEHCCKDNKPVKCSLMVV